MKPLDRVFNVIDQAVDDLLDIRGQIGSVDCADQRGLVLGNFYRHIGIFIENVDEYFKSLTPVPSPYLVDGQLSEAGLRGELLFNRLGCANCHPAPYFTDQMLHTMGTLGPRDTGPYDGTWDTPTLIESWRTAPYLHDGRCATLKEVFTREQHGNAQGLNEQEIDDLVDYVGSL